jgi:hypothetical protein
MIFLVEELLCWLKSVCVVPLWLFWLLSHASTECCWLQNWSKGKEAVNNTMLFGRPPAELEQGQDGISDRRSGLAA